MQGGQGGERPRQEGGSPYTGSLKKVMNRILRAMLGDQIFRLKWPKVVQSGPNWQKQSKNSLNGPKWSKNIV